MLSVLLPCLLSLSCAAAPNEPAAPAVVPAVFPAVFPAVAAGDVASSNGPSAFRLRKLHLVRPDLIPYPLAFSVYC